MLKVIVLKGVPSSGKSSWAKQKVAEDPFYLRVNNDDLRALLHNSVFSKENESLITATRQSIIRLGLKNNKNIIVDNVNAGKQNFDEVLKIAQQSGKDVEIIEKPFYIELDEAIKRDSLRTGTAKVGEEVIKKFWNKLGKRQFEHYHPRIEIVLKGNGSIIENNEKIIEEENSKIPAILVDLDGTISLFNKTDGHYITIQYPGAHVRNPYDASNADNDMLNEQVAFVIKQYQKNNHTIIFCSGRKDMYEPQTRRFLDKHFDFPYILHMRKSDDNRSDHLVKEEIYKNHIKPTYKVSISLDDRSKVVDHYRSLGLTVWQVATGDF